MMRDLFFFGDSITYGEWDEQGGWVQRLRSSIDQTFMAGRGPKTHVYNLGVTGHTSEDLLKRVEPEMAARFNPEAETLAIFAIGMNDAHYMVKEARYHRTPEEFEANLGRLIGAARKYTRNIALVGLNPVDQQKVDPLPWNTNKAYRMERVRLFNEVIEKIAAEEELFFVDIWKSWSLMSYKTLLCDGLHPNASGHRRIAEKVSAFLKVTKRG
ncbi:MAG: SGNH/GDSL hydrolase family protein [Micavibrio sp.]|nr:SGNH/GDSL hydrolase family protein [Micavibrio sp.]